MPIPSDTADPSVRRGRHYYETVVFDVEGVVHRVPKYGLEECSSVLRDMFSLPQPTNSESGTPSFKEGDADDNPIELVGCTNQEFESLIDVMYPLLRRTPELSKEKWVGVLKLSRLWDMPEVAAIAIEKLSAFDLKPVEKVKLGKEHGVPSWLKEGYTTLVDDLSKASLSDMTSLGWETSFRILWARDEIARSKTSPNAGGYWIKSQDVLCGYCWGQNKRRSVVSQGSSPCITCGQYYATGYYGIQIPSFTALSSTTLESTADARSKVVADKVAEVFEEELKEAESRNAIPAWAAAIESSWPTAGKGKGKKGRHAGAGRLLHV